jgi:hypothetical protein
LKDDFKKKEIEHSLLFYFAYWKDFPVSQTPYIDLPQYASTKYKKKKAESPPMVMPFRLGLCPEEVLAWVVLIEMAFRTILFRLFHIRFTGEDLRTEHQEKAPR